MKRPAGPLHSLNTSLRWSARTHLSVPRSRCGRHRLRPALPSSQEDQHLHRAGRPKAWHQGSRRGHLARQLHALRSGILRLGAEDLATPRQPVRPEARYRCLRYDIGALTKTRFFLHSWHDSPLLGRAEQSTPEARRGAARAGLTATARAEQNSHAMDASRWNAADRPTRSAPNWIDFGVNDLETFRQPERPEVVTHVSGTICYLCVRAGHGERR